MYHIRYFYNIKGSSKVEIWYDESLYDTFREFLNDIDNILFKFALGAYFENKMIKTDGPYVIVYDENDNIIDIKWVYKGKIISNDVNKWIEENNFDKWQDMCEDDFNRMWIEIF